MEEIIYLEVPTPDIVAVRHWLQQQWIPIVGKKIITSDGIRLQRVDNASESLAQFPEKELSIFVWSVQRTTYLKVFRWGNQLFPSEKKVCDQLVKEIRKKFPPEYKALPELNASVETIFAEL
ncbi:MAG: flavin-dependent dehydrogenase, partial [Cyanobacteria bacterium P01_G01_bin.49]